MYIKSFLIACFLLFIGGSMNAQEFEYIGAAKCKTCHNKASVGAQYKQWLGTKHAKAMESLEGDEKTDPKCIKCHSTYGAVDENLIATLKISEGVSCESCHAPGSGDKSNSIMKNKEKAMERGLILPTKEGCITCHNEESPHYKGFDFDEYVKDIDHPRPPKEE